MENKKTISWLNSKIWYRFIKVIYLGFLTGFLIIPSVIIFNHYAPKYDNDNSYIKCANGKEFTLSKVGISLYGEYIPEYNKEAIKNLCFDGVRNFETHKIGSFEYQAPVEIISQTENSGKYELISKYTNRNWVDIVKFSSLSVLATLLVFELIRRIFYYVITGKIRPEK